VYVTANWAHQKLHHKYSGSFAMCFMGRMGKIIWMDYVKIEEVLHKAQNEKNIIYTTTKKCLLDWSYSE
jgi:hypothetical protein